MSLSDKNGNDMDKRYRKGGCYMKKKKERAGRLKRRSVPKGILFYLKRDWRLYVMLVLPVAYYAIFKYIPMYGVTIAFRDYNLFKGILILTFVPDPIWD